MRPGQRCPGILGGPAELVAADPAASMRPGQRCPGIDRMVNHEERTLPSASMRPGQRCPGIPSNRSSVRGALRRRFNEAGATLPRNLRDARGEEGQRRPASMRPGQRCPGIIPALRLPRACRVASMRPGQRCPGIRSMPVFCTSPSRPASMRPGQRCPGIWRPSRTHISKPTSFNEAGATLPRNRPP